VFADIVEERLDNAGESAVPNLGDNLAKLIAWHQCQHVVPIFQWELAEIVLVVCKIKLPFLLDGK
jgi:hypothetical protein